LSVKPPPLIADGTALTVLPETFVILSRDSEDLAGPQAFRENSTYQRQIRSLGKLTKSVG
jgi:hypothetical protein